MIGVGTEVYVGVGLECVGLGKSAVADIGIGLKSNRLLLRLLWLGLGFRSVAEQIEDVDVGLLRLNVGCFQSQVHERLLLLLWLDRITSDIEDVDLLLHRHWLLWFFLEAIDIKDILRQRWFLCWFLLDPLLFLLRLRLFPLIAVQFSKDEDFWLSIFLKILKSSIGLLYNFSYDVDVVIDC